MDEGLEMLRRLKSLGFDHVSATPHTRPGMFDNTNSMLRAAFWRMKAQIPTDGDFPEVSLASEHFFDETVVTAIHSGDGLPYRRICEEQQQPRLGGAILIEFLDFPPITILRQQLFELKRAGFLPVIAHPERYRTAWNRPELVEELVEQGSVALLDTCALVGKYGRHAQRCAEELIEREVYDAACSDSHRPDDVILFSRGIEWIQQRYGEEEVTQLFKDGPNALLDGRSPRVS